MNKIYFDNLVLDITQKCNMKCAHCLCGEAGNIDIDINYIQEVLKHTAFIGTIHFSGGEPTLNVEIIDKTLTLCKYYKIPVLNFGIISNGKYIPENFIQYLLNWHKYCAKFNTKNATFGNLYISNDIFHEPIPTENIDKLKILPFFRNTKIDYKKGRRILNLGRAKNITNYLKYAPAQLFVDIKKYNGNLYTNEMYTTITAKGNILPMCDYSYEIEDSIRICRYNNILETFNSIGTETKNFCWDPLWDAEYSSASKYFYANPIIP